VSNVLTVSPSVLRTGLVVSVDTMQVPGAKKVLALPSIGYEVRFSTAEIREMQKPQFMAFAKEYRAQFAAPFDLYRRKWFADIRKVVHTVEGEVRQLGPRNLGNTPEAIAQMGPLVEGANAQLNARCAAYTEALQQLGQTAYQSALRASCRAAKVRPVKSAVRVEAEFVITTPVPPAVPNVAVARFVVMPTPKRW
jgi:hypothetical protein